MNAVSGAHTPIILAADRGNNFVVEMLLKAGAKVDPFTEPSAQSALQHATYRNNFKLVKILVKAGADVNFQAVDKTGDTALHVAVSNGNIEIINYLLKHGANPTIKSEDGVTPLSLADEGGNKEVISIIKSAISSWEGKKEL